MIDGIKLALRGLGLDTLRLGDDDLLTLDELIELVGDRSALLLDMKAPGYELEIAQAIPGDIAAVVSRLEDAVTQGVDAIVVNVDPAQVEAGLAQAQAAGIHSPNRYGTRDAALTPEQVAKLQVLVASGKLTDKLARQVLEGVLAGEGDPEQIMAARGLEVVSDTGALTAAVVGR